MACLVKFPGNGKADYTVLKGKLVPGKPRRWRITVWYDVGILNSYELDGKQFQEKNPQIIKIGPTKPLMLSDISAHITAALDEDVANRGGVTNIRWQAAQER